MVKTASVPTNAAVIVWESTEAAKIVSTQAQALRVQAHELVPLAMASAGGTRCDRHTKCSDPIPVSFEILACLSVSKAPDVMELTK